VNAVEIEEAVSQLAGLPFDAGEFAFAFLEAFGKNLVFMLLMIALAFLLGAIFHQPISTVWALIAESGH